MWSLNKLRIISNVDFNRDSYSLKNLVELFLQRST